MHDNTFIENTFIDEEYNIGKENNKKQLCIDLSKDEKKIVSG